MKQLFIRHLKQLKTLLSKIPEDLLDKSLTGDMFDLQTQTKIAANFALRGYCPLLKLEVPNYQSQIVSKGALIEQIDASILFLEQVDDVSELNNAILIPEKAGFADVELGQVDFIHNYILPNMLFHMAMVYAIARSNGVPVSKGDFDGIHQYPEAFSFIESQ